MDIKRLREAKGWTQAQLAERVGVGKRTVGNWERGETVPKNRLGMLRELFSDQGDDDPIRAASDSVLLAELLRRAAARESYQR